MTVETGHEIGQVAVLMTRSQPGNSGISNGHPLSEVWFAPASAVPSLLTALDSTVLFATDLNHMRTVADPSSEQYVELIVLSLLFFTLATIVVLG